MKITEEVKISDNGFVFNPGTGDSFHVNPMGLELIRYLKEDMDFDRIKELILERYDVDDLTFEKDYYEFCVLLRHHQIFVQDNPTDFK